MANRSSVPVRSRAARRPDDIVRTREETAAGGARAPKNSGSGHTASVRSGRARKSDRNGTDGSYRYSDTSRASGRMSGKSARTGRELTVSRQEKRALVAARKEAEWQGEVERVRGGVDRIMLAIILLLLALGAIMVYSASYPTALIETGGADSLYYLKRHLIFLSIGGVLMFIISRIPYTRYKDWGPFAAYGVAVVLLLAVLVMGTSEGEAKRWIYIGSFSIQPSEIMKVSLVLMLAWYIDKYQGKMKERRGLLNTFIYNELYPLALIGFACILVLLEKHLSGTAIIGIIGIAVMLVGGCHVGYTLATSAVGGGVAAVAFILMNPYALKRLTTFTSDNVDVLNEGWQTTQGILAIGSGGFFGRGFSASQQKFSYVSMAHNDFIFTIWCEELGFIGALFLIALFIAFVWRGYVVAMRAPDTFSMLAVFGIVTQVGLQAMLNMMVVCDIIPNTGISLPFFSYGGSSLVMLMAEMGIILSVSRQFYRKKPVA